VRALLVSTYELGRPPFGLASPAAWLRREGVEVRLVDLAREPLPTDEVRDAALVAFHLPMHTATRLAGPVIERVRLVNPGAVICAYGLYAPLNDAWLRSLGVDEVIGAEFEGTLAALARRVMTGDARVPIPQDNTSAVASVAAGIPRLQFLAPDRTGLLPLARYATLQMADGTRQLAGYTEASRGCRHLCRHCPIVPVYRGQFRVVQPEVVQADVAAQVALGARHITFGDPDFFNGPTHAMRVVEALHAAFPDVTYDVTIKVEHLLQHRSLLGRLQETGCLFITSAVESLDDKVLATLEKGHTRQDFVDAVSRCREAGVTLVPTFVAFHPWLTLEDYCDLVDTIASLGLVDRVAPIQLAIRLLIPASSRLLELEDVRRLVGPYDATTLAFAWTHPDARVDALQRAVASIAAGPLGADRRAAFDAIRAVAHERAGSAMCDVPVSDEVTPVPHLDEPWYCCAEPNPDQLPRI
jgi:radical SAM superfamily enzyme YgiQ (UPF0313 family)